MPHVLVLEQISYPRLARDEVATLEQVKEVVGEPELLPLLYDVHLLELFFAAVNRAGQHSDASGSKGEAGAEKDASQAASRQATGRKTHRYA